MNNRTMAIVAIAAVAAMLIATSMIATDSAFATKYKKTQTAAQANACGNGKLPLKIFCQAINSQLQGNDNAVNVIGVQPS
jgi:hypothetical protein